MCAKALAVKWQVKSTKPYPLLKPVLLSLITWLNRLVKKGKIVPSAYCHPQMMEDDTQIDWHQQFLSLAC